MHFKLLFISLTLSFLESRLEAFRLAQLDTFFGAESMGYIKSSLYNRLAAMKMVIARVLLSVSRSRKIPHNMSICHCSSDLCIPG